MSSFINLSHHISNSLPFYESWQFAKSNEPELKKPLPPISYGPYNEFRAWDYEYRANTRERLKKMKEFAEKALDGAIKECRNFINQSYFAIELNNYAELPSKKDLSTLQLSLLKAKQCFTERVARKEKKIEKLQSCYVEDFFVTKKEKKLLKCKDSLEILDLTNKAINDLQKFYNDPLLNLQEIKDFFTKHTLEEFSTFIAGKDPTKLAIFFCVCYENVKEFGLEINFLNALFLNILKINNLEIKNFVLKTLENRFLDADHPASAIALIEEKEIKFNLYYVVLKNSFFKNLFLQKINQNNGKFIFDFKEVTIHQWSCLLNYLRHNLFFSSSNEPEVYLDLIRRFLLPEHLIKMVFEKINFENLDFPSKLHMINLAGKYDVSKLFCNSLKISAEDDFTVIDEVLEPSNELVEILDLSELKNLTDDQFKMIVKHFPNLSVITISPFCPMTKSGWWLLTVLNLKQVNFEMSGVYIQGEAKKHFNQFLKLLKKYDLKAGLKFLNGGITFKKYISLAKQFKILTLEGIQLVKKTIWNKEVVCKIQDINTLISLCPDVPQDEFDILKSRVAMLNL